MNRDDPEWDLLRFLLSLYSCINNLFNEIDNPANQVPCPNLFDIYRIEANPCGGQLFIDDLPDRPLPRRIVVPDQP